jgi:uncharacterized Zn-binding protein involved in type VI secretion
MKPFICVGDKTSGGGVVVSGSPTNTINGKQMARVGDKATCSKKNHPRTVTIVASSDPTVITDDAPQAFHGDPLSCGCTLIASQFTTNSDPRTSSSEVMTMDWPSAASNSQQNAAVADSQEDEILEQWFSLEDESGQSVTGYRYDLYKDDELHTKAGSYDSGVTTKITGDADLRIVTWLAHDSAERANG